MVGAMPRIAADPTPPEPPARPRGGGLTGEFGGRSRKVAVVGAILLVAAGVAGIGQDWLQHRREGIADYKAWMVAGPRCPPPPKAMPGAPAARPLQITNFGGVGFARQHGATQCSDIAADGGRGYGSFPVCQFDHPGVLEVSTRRGLYRFRAGIMNPATVSVRDGIPTCVVGASQDFGHQLVFDPTSSSP
jgi:hypothetical protein